MVKCSHSSFLTGTRAMSLRSLSAERHSSLPPTMTRELLSASLANVRIRIWHLPYAVASPKAVPPPIVVPAKSVSDLDYYAPEQVLVTGSHDVGRAMIWRPIDGEWKVDKILSGHLHGTRAVA